MWSINISIVLYLFVSALWISSFWCKDREQVMFKFVNFLRFEPLKVKNLSLFSRTFPNPYVVTQIDCLSKFLALSYHFYVKSVTACEQLIFMWGESIRNIKCLVFTVVKTIFVVMYIIDHLHQKDLKRLILQIWKYVKWN